MSIPPLWICPPATDQRLAELREQLDRWTSAEPLRTLVNLFDGELPEAPLAERLIWLEKFSEQWDFRRQARELAEQQSAQSQDADGSARWELAGSGLQPEDDRRIIELATELGLVKNQPPVQRDVDLLLILGGARLSNLLRPRYAAELIAGGFSCPSRIVLLGGSRAVKDSERDATDTYAPGAATEFDLLSMAAADELGFDLETRREDAFVDEKNPNGSWRVWHVETTEMAVPITAIEAPSPEPNKRRANTADSYAFLVEKLRLEARTGCLLVTSQIYVPYQHLEAVRSLAVPFELELETCGFPADWQADLQGMQNSVNYLQETRSTLQAAMRVYDAHLCNEQDAT